MSQSYGSLQSQIIFFYHVLSIQMLSMNDFDTVLAFNIFYKLSTCPFMIITVFDCQ